MSSSPSIRLSGTQVELMADCIVGENKTEVDLVDVGGGNVGSVRRSLQRLGVKFHDVGAGNLPSGLRPLILPGVGAFGTVMKALAADGLDRRVKSLVLEGTPLLGICVGMQVLFHTSEESPGSKGLSLIDGQVRKFQHGKVPQIGWNKVEPQQDGWEPGFVYFVNSYFPQPERDDVTLYQADYGQRFCAAIRTGNITAFQFHPEKSGEFGSRLLQKWVHSVS